MGFIVFSTSCWMSVETHLLYVVHGPIMAALLVTRHVEHFYKLKYQFIKDLSLFYSESHLMLRKIFFTSH